MFLAASLRKTQSDGCLLPITLARGSLCDWIVENQAVILLIVSMPDECTNFLLQVLGEELCGAVPGEFRALSVVVWPRLIAKGMAGVIPVGFKGDLAFF